MSQLRSWAKLEMNPKEIGQPEGLFLQSKNSEAIFNLIVYIPNMISIFLDSILTKPSHMHKCRCAADRITLQIHYQLLAHDYRN